MNKQIFKKMYEDEQDQYSEYGWIFVIVFFLVLFLSQSFFSFMLGPIGSGLVWLLLTIWSAVATWYLLFGNAHEVYKKMVGKITSLREKREDVEEDEEDAEEYKEPEKPKRVEMKQFARKRPAATENFLEKKLEQEAHDMGALISKKGLQHIISFGGGAEKILKDVISEGKKTYPRFDGWVVLNKAQIVNLLARDGEDRVPFQAIPDEVDSENEEVLKESAITEELHTPPTGEEMNEGVLGVGTSTPKTFAKKAAPPSNLPVNTARVKHETAIGRFMELLCAGNEEALFGFIREMRGGTDRGARIFITNAVLTLDEIHSHRTDGGGYVNKTLLEKAKCFSNEELEEIVTILVGGVDYRYRIPDIGTKLSLVRTLEYIREHRKA